MMRAGTKMPPARCAACLVDGPAKSSARKAGWTSTGPQQRRAWWCPAHRPPPVVATPVAPVVQEVLAQVSAKPSEPFAALRWERDHAQPTKAAEGPQFNMMDELRSRPDRR